LYKYLHMKDFSFLDNGFTDTYNIIENLDAISKKYKLKLPPEFEQNLIYVQKEYNSSKILYEGTTKIVLDGFDKSYIKIYKNDIQFDQEFFFYRYLKKNNYLNILAKTMFYRCYSIQNKIETLSKDEEVPYHLRGIIVDSGAEQFGKDSHGNVLILDFENINLKRLKLDIPKNLQIIFDKKE